MSYQEKRSIMALISNILIFGIYSVYIYHLHLDGDIDLVSNFSHWGLVFVILIPISIIANIIIHIIFHIIIKIANDEDDPGITDERDKMIELRATRNSHYILMIGFLLSMGALAMEMPVYVMFMILIGSGFVSSIADEISKLVYYRRGF